MKELLMIPLAILAHQVDAWWQPPAATTWQIILSHGSNVTGPPPANVTALDADLFDVSEATWASIKSAGHKTICYFSAGSYENWRQDKANFTTSDYKDGLDGWPGEFWLNTNSANVRNIMQSRMDLAKQKGCDAVDPDNMDAYNNGGGGFKLTQDDAVDYATFLANEAHRRGMACGLKNALEIIPRVVTLVDFQVNEQCVQNKECDKVQPFIQHNKPVFNIEYPNGNKDVDSSGAFTVKQIDDYCSSGDRPQTFETLLKEMSLNANYYVCPVQTASNASSTAAPSQPSDVSSSSSRIRLARNAVLTSIAVHLGLLRL